MTLYALSLFLGLCAVMFLPIVAVLVSDMLADIQDTFNKD